MTLNRVSAATGPFCAMRVAPNARYLRTPGATDRRRIDVPGHWQGTQQSD
jgi:hypothetical protein